MSFIKFFLQLLLINFCSANIWAQTTTANSECQKFHLGLFTMPLESGGEIKITRMKDYQIEEYHDESITLKIKWMSECEYHLTITNTNVLSKEKANLVGKVLKVKITKVEGNTYHYSATIDGENLVIENKVTKIK